MKLSLANFRNHQDSEIELPETGLVRISGRSGTGKSAYLNAVSWCLYNIGNKVVTWGEKSASVSLQGFGLDVTRTKSPNYLSCNNDKTVTAQSEIERILGMNKTEFEISSYVSQGQRNSLINLTPSEQLNVIHSIAFKDKDPESYKERISGFIKDLDKKIAFEQKTIEVQEAKIGQLKKSIDSMELMYEEPAENLEAVSERIANLRSEISELQQSIHEQRKSMRIDQESLNHPNRAEFDRAWKFLETVDERILELNNSLQEKLPLFEINQQEEQARLRKMNAEVQNLTREHAKLKQNEKNAVNRSSLVSMIASSVDKVNTLTKFGTLDFSVLDDIQPIADKFSDIKQHAEIALTALDGLRIASSEEELQKNKKEMSDISDRLKQILSDIEKFTGEQERARRHNSEIIALQEQIASLAQKKENARSIIERNSELEDIETLKNSIAMATNKITEQVAAESAKQKEIEHALALKLRIKKAQEIKVEIFKLNNQLSQENEAIDALRAVNGANLKLYEQSSKLLSFWSKAALDVVEATIDELNLRASFWLDILLEGKVRAELKTTKKIKSKDAIVDSLNLEIMYKGQVLEKVSEELSGGQFSRVILAYQLGLSDIFNSPILMLDEALRGCDQETINVCLDAIRTIADRKLVIVVEHNIPSHYFDKEIELADL